MSCPTNEFRHKKFSITLLDAGSNGSLNGLQCDDVSSVVI